MDTKLRKKALAQLAQTEGDKALGVLKTEADRIGSVLALDTGYDALETAIELLDTIAYRMPERAVALIAQFLVRLETLEITYAPVPGLTEARLRKYHNTSSITVKALEVLEHIRYHRLEDVLSLFLDHALAPDRAIRDQAEQGLKSLTEYNIAAYEHFGVGAQSKVIEYLKKLNSAYLQSHIAPITLVCHELLSPSMQRSVWGYDTVTWQTAAVPAMDATKEIRASAISVLQKLYALAETVEQKRSILNALMEARRTHHPGEYGDDFLRMVRADTVRVLEFLLSLVPNTDLELVQRIEHDSYWAYRHTDDEKVKRVALQIRDALDKHLEYQIFKVLIGFEGVFGDWDRQEDYDWDEQNKLRADTAKNYAESITEENFEQWRERILYCAKVNSNDLATFPHFGRFLEHFGEVAPELVLRLLRENAEELVRFITACLLGLWKSERQPQASALMEEWISQGRYLLSCARLFEFRSNLDEAILHKIFDRAKAQGNVATLMQIMMVAAVHFETKRRKVLEDFFLPAVSELTKHEQANWVFSFGYRKEHRAILSALTVSEVDVILDNLLHLPFLDFHAEEVLVPIAEKHPGKVIRFFGKRLNAKKEMDLSDNYRAIPFEFHRLAEPLSASPELAVDIVREWYDGHYGLFTYQGGALLKRIFPKFPNAFERHLTEVVNSGDDDNLLFVMAILRNYEGEPFLHNICRELVKILGLESDHITVVVSILESTGIVSGAFGLVEAFERKRDDIRPWLDDPDSSVREFAKRYIGHLGERIEAERQHAEESIALRKFEYGEGDNEGI